MLPEEEFLLPGWRTCWYGSCSSWFRRKYEGVVVDTIVLLGRKDDPEVDVFPYTKVAINRICVRHKELLALLDGGVVGIDHVIGE